MAGFENLKNFGDIIAVGKLLNAAFKKEEIRRPVKMRHHECRLQDTGDGSLRMVAPHLNTVCYVMMRKIGSMHWDADVIDPKYDGVFMGQIFFMRTTNSERGHFSTSWNCMNHEFKSDRLQDYFALAAAQFFDFVHSVGDPKEVDNSDTWSRRVETIEARNKWR